MIEYVLTKHGKGQIVFVRCHGIQRPMSALTSAQAATTKSTAARTAVRSAASAGCTLDARAKSEYFADAQIEAYIGRPGAEIVRDDLFARAEGIGIKTAKGRGDGVGLAATGGEGGARVELIVARQVGARRDVVGSSRVDGKEWRER